MGYLQNSQLRGAIPPELDNLANLTTLDLRGNQLSGEIPSELGNLASLQILDLADNQCVDRKTGEPSRGDVGVFRLDKNRERVFNYDWFALAPPTPDEIKEAHLAQNPRPSTSTKPREAGTTPLIPDRG